MSAPQLQNYIAGEWIAGASTSKDVNPSDTGDVIAEYAQADKTQTEHAIEAAVQGAGLLLTHTLLAHDEVVSGRLATPFDVVLPVGRAYYLVWPKTKQARPGVDAFRAWVRAEVAPHFDEAADAGPHP